MGSFTETRTTSATPDAVWKVLDDVGNIARWSSGVATSRIRNNIERGIGAERHCEFDAQGKKWVNERVTARGDDHMVIQIYETNAPVHSIESTTRVRPVGSGSRIDMTIDMDVKGGPLAPILEMLLMRPHFRKAVTQLLADLDNAATHGSQEAPA